MKHTLNARMKDFFLELKLWFLAWLITSAAGVAAVIYYLQPNWDAVVWLWRNYLLAKLLDFVGLGAFPVIPLPPNWLYPSNIIKQVHENLPTAAVAKWDHDFWMIVQTPVAAAVLLAVAYLVFLDKKKD